MYYKVKKRDTLEKIASKQHVSLELLLAFNPKLFIDFHLLTPEELLYVPNILENPEQKYHFSELTSSGIVEKARSAIGKGIKYELGKGGTAKDVGRHLPTSSGGCDCSGFVCWIYGLSRQSEIPFYRQLGGWINTDSMVLDIKSEAGIFGRLNIPEIGCIVVYGRRKAGQYGHVGIVSEVENGIMKKVIHCSKGNDDPEGNSIQETSSKVFNASDIFLGRFVG